MFLTRNDMTPETRVIVIALLNLQLADEADLHSQTKYAHWNVKGPQFIMLHKLFDELAEKLDEHIDELAERVTALGGIAHGTLRQAAGNTRVAEFPATAIHGEDVLIALAERYAAVGKTTRAAIDDCDKLGDKGTADLLTGISRDLDQSLYFLEAHLQSE